MGCFCCKRGIGVGVGVLGGELRFRNGKTPSNPTPNTVAIYSFILQIRFRAKYLGFKGTCNVLSAQ